MSSLKSISKFQIFSVILSVILGTFLHFVFQWSSYNPVIAAFSATNESVWEHLKLVFFPMLLSTILGYFIFSKQYPTFLYAKTCGILFAISFITIFFYTYSGIIGKNFLFLDIMSFFVAIFLGEYLSFKKMLSNSFYSNKLAITILLILLLCFILFTYYPPKINYFYDPITQSYGISHLKN